jgi:hypothetical protein
MSVLSAGLQVQEMPVRQMFLPEGYRDLPKETAEEGQDSGTGGGEDG